MRQTKAFEGQMCPWKSQSWILRHDNNLSNILILPVERHGPDKEIGAKQSQKQA